MGRATHTHTPKDNNNNNNLKNNKERRYRPRNLKEAFLAFPPLLHVGSHQDL
jgi:hypothetical protein